MLYVPCGTEEVSVKLSLITDAVDAGMNNLGLKAEVPVQTTALLAFLSSYVTFQFS
jgi:hypothetical protein